MNPLLAIARAAGWLLLAAILIGCDPTSALRSTEDRTAPAAVQEDSPAWDCRTMGNKVCGADNAQGVAPGYYGGVR
jgi:hypothetical protein